jgi:hypothetical protein
MALKENFHIVVRLDNEKRSHHLIRKTIWNRGKSNRWKNDLYSSSFFNSNLTSVVATLGAYSVHQFYSTAV